MRSKKCGNMLFVLCINIIVFYSLGAKIAYGQNGIPADKITMDWVNPRLEFAKISCDKGDHGAAALEIENKLKADSSLLTQAAIILGGNYHLVRLTDNVFADRVGGFSPSSSKLIYARDTSLMRLDDGVFNWYEDRTTGIVYYDFQTGREIEPDLPHENPHRPRFFTDESFFYLSGNGSNTGLGGSTTLYLYDLEPARSTECFVLNGQEYCSINGGVVVFDHYNDSFVYKNIETKVEKMLFDNENVLNFRRPLPLIRNLSAGYNAILFEAGHTSGRMIKNIYGLPLGGGKPRLLINDFKEFLCDAIYFPAAVNENEFAYLAGDNNDVDIYYRKDDKSYRLTFDGGEKHYLAISPDGLKLAYSYMIEKEGIESFEIFILDFSQKAMVSDLMYRIKALK